MAVGWFIAELGLGGMLATLTAALPDRVPVGQRGTLGALIGISQMLGTVLGALLVTVIITRMAGRVRGLRGHRGRLRGRVHAAHHRTSRCRPSTSRTTRSRRRCARLWVSPRAYPDFAWGWVTHFLVNLGNDLGTLYLLYFLSRGAHYHDPQTGC